MDESCGKCIPCRAGTVQLYQLLTKIREGEASLADLEQLEELCDMVKYTSLCGLGQSAPNPVLSTLRYFRDEYLALIGDRMKAVQKCRIDFQYRLIFAYTQTMHHCLRSLCFYKVDAVH